MIRRLPYLGSFFVHREIDYEAEDYYNFIVDSILYYKKVFDNNIDIMDILSLPYNLFQDLIIRQIKMKQEEKGK